MSQANETWVRKCSEVPMPQVRECCKHLPADVLNLTRMAAGAHCHFTEHWLSKACAYDIMLEAKGLSVGQLQNWGKLRKHGKSNPPSLCPWVLYFNWLKEYFILRKMANNAIFLETSICSTICIYWEARIMRKDCVRRKILAVVFNNWIFF